MSLDEVADEIREEAEDEAERIVAEAEDEAEAILDSARDEADGIRHQREKELEEEVEALRQQELASARLTARKRRLDAEREVLDEVRETLEQEIRDLPDSTRKKHIQALVERAAIEDGTIRLAERDAELAEDAGLEVAGTFDGLGGVEIEAPDGSYTENLRYEDILDDVWQDARQEVVDRLLPDK
jgi:V/A-type H+-transporting ATPase subunit E